MESNQKTITLDEFQRNASEFVKKVQSTKEAIFLTVDGKLAVVVQDIGAYQAMTDACEYAETVAILRERLDYIDSGGECLTSEEVFDRLTKKYDTSSD